MVSILADPDMVNERIVNYANIGIYNTQALKILR